MRIPTQLTQEIEAGHCVAFVGAGFSAAAQLPPWGRLLESVSELADVDETVAQHVATRVRHGTAHALDEAAQLLEDRLGRDRLLQELCRILGSPSPTPPMEARLRLLRGIPFRTVLTTNFDGVLRGVVPDHEAYRQALRPDAYRWWEGRYWLGDEGAFTLKLHGDLGAAEASNPQVVLTRRDYRRRLYEDPAYSTFLRATMATNTVLYMGFSFEDAYLNELRSEILALLGHRDESAPVAYAIVNDVPEPTVEHFRRHEGIEVLTYDTDGGRNFSGFDQLLQAIHEATNPLVRFGRHLEHRRILWVDPHPENNEEGFRFLLEAARAAGRESYALVTVPDAEAALTSLESATAKGEPFDVTITHWGDRGDPYRDPTAVTLLTGIRTKDIRCPVVVFAARRDVSERKHTALGLGARHYCYSFQKLFQVLEDVLSPGE